MIHVTWLPPFPMARWKITAFVNSSVGVQTYEIDSSTSYGAVELVKNVYQV